MQRKLPSTEPAHSNVDELNAKFSIKSQNCTKLWSACTKNPGHKSFIPVKEFQIQHLPPECRDEDVFDCIKATAKLTVRIRAENVSGNRPEGDRFYSVRGKQFARTGSGSVRQVFSGSNTHKCNCRDCTVKNKRENVAIIVIHTARHVVFDESEARGTFVDLFYDDDKCNENVKTLVGSHIVNSSQEHDECVFACTTDNSDLAETLNRNLSDLQRLQLAAHRKLLGRGSRLAAVVSHPHGCSKHISIGKLKTSVGDSSETRKTAAGDSTHSRKTAARASSEAGKTAADDSSEVQTEVGGSSEARKTAARASSEAGKTAADDSSEARKTAASGSSEALTEVGGSSEAQTEVGDSSEAQTEVGDSSEARTEVGGSSEARTEVGDSSEARTEVGGSSEAQTEVSDSSEARTEVSDSSEARTEVSDSSEARTEVSDSSEARTEVGGSSEAWTEVSDSSEARTEVSDSSEARTEVGGSSEARTEVGDSSEARTEVGDSSEARTEVGGSSDTSRREEPSSTRLSASCVHAFFDSDKVIFAIYPDGQPVVPIGQSSLESESTGIEVTVELPDGTKTQRVICQIDRPVAETKKWLFSDCGITEPAEQFEMVLELPGEDIQILKDEKNIDYYWDDLCMSIRLYFQEKVAQPQ